ncbi:RES family NAD+ phosphorylase [Deinococcus sp. MIMF12]|uniref:RES family NAD+ phosphorylase n=1 Tax=Deinococcus rhizophilus TaxID=3049544 RepID=A0ABT7JJF3_9DEIO|nr:RES family NAD+ phosphorylase [Deinococcus rhizophilus]MDL2343789.1 RES family NAD+ phosphorylase [Deinococcus rhizophilus]
MREPPPLRAHQARTSRLIPSRYEAQTPRPSVLGAITQDPDEFDILLDLDNLTNGRVTSGQGVTYQPYEQMVLAAFEHAGNNRFNVPVPGHGAWYAADRLVTCVHEVAHHFKARAIDEGLTDTLHVTEYTVYECDAQDTFYDAMQDPDYRQHLAIDPDSYAYSQPLGEEVRAQNRAGIVYESVRAPEPGQTCVVFLQPWAVRHVGRTSQVYLLWDPARQAAVATRVPPSPAVLRT